MLNILRNGYPTCYNIHDMSMIVNKGQQLYQIWCCKIVTDAANCHLMYNVKMRQMWIFLFGLHDLSCTEVYDIFFIPTVTH